MVWNDAPSHVCRGGDSRALAFCCPPLKPCPILNALNDVKLSPQEYIEIKNDFSKKTKLGKGTETCFRSLVWCCKTSKPCSIRDMALKSINMSVNEYLTLKKHLAELLTGNDIENSEDNINVLVDVFSINKDEAIKVLYDCDNDLRMAMKILRVKALEKSVQSF